MKAELEALVRGNPHIWRANAPHPEQDLAVDSGIDKLNDFLPAGGWPAGSVVELLVDDWGIGERHCCSSKRHQQLISCFSAKKHSKPIIVAHISISTSHNGACF